MVDRPGDGHGLSLTAGKRANRLIRVPDMRIAKVDIDFRAVIQPVAIGVRRKR